jgi:hypothetical protein
MCPGGKSLGNLTVKRPGCLIRFRPGNGGGGGGGRLGIATWANGGGTVGFSDCANPVIANNIIPPVKKTFTFFIHKFLITREIQKFADCIT